MKCEATIILSLGCTASNCMVIAEEKTNVPSLPAKSLAIFMVVSCPPNKFEVSNIIETTALKALRSGINKLPISCSIIDKKHYI